MPLAKSASPLDTNKRRLLRTSDASRYLGVGSKRIRQLIVCGQLPYVQLQPGSNSPYLIDVRDLDSFIESQKHRN